MSQVTLRHGEPVVVPYTPSGGNVSAGDVVVQGSITANTAGTGAIACVAHRPITNNTLGGLAIGGGVYEGTNRNNAAAGTKVYWDDTNNWFTTVAVNNAVFGFVVANGAGGTNSSVLVFHAPFYAAN